MDLYDDVLAASSQPSESCTSSSEPPVESRQEQSPKPNSKSPAILYTYSGLRNKRAAVYVGSFSWVSEKYNKLSSWKNYLVIVGYNYLVIVLEGPLLHFYFYYRTTVFSSVAFQICEYQL